MSFPKYEVYRDSGVEWVDVLPFHWDGASLRWLSSIFAGGTPDKKNLDFWTDGSIPWLNSGSVNQRLITEPSSFITIDAYQCSSAKWIPEGSLVIALAGQGKTKGMVAQLGITATCNQSMAAIVPNKKSGARYVYWWLTNNYQNIRNLAGGNLRDGLNLEMVGSIYTPIPPTEEQIQIARFLDHETARIDALIAEQQRLIELLKEKRQAVISHAVTKGLDPTVPMKDSGVEWLGEVPAHWASKKLSFIGEAIIGLTYSPADVVDEDEGLLVLRSSNVQDGKISLHDNVFVNKVVPQKLIVREDDILICSRNGSRDLIGKNALIDKDAKGMTFGAFMTVYRSQINQFLLWVFNSHIFSAQAGSFMTSTVNQLTTGTLNSFLVPLPPLPEQAQIAQFLNRETARIDALIAEAHAGVSLLQERRSALISAAVTGKIDVRNWHPPANTQTEPTPAIAHG